MSATSYVLIKRALRPDTWPIENDDHARDVVRSLRAGSIDIAIYPLCPGPNGDRYPWGNIDSEWSRRLAKAKTLPELMALSDGWSVRNCQRLHDAMDGQPPLTFEDMSCVKYLEGMNVRPHPRPDNPLSLDPDGAVQPDDGLSPS